MNLSFIFSVFLCHCLWDKLMNIQAGKPGKVVSTLQTNGWWAKVLSLPFLHAPGKLLLCCLAELRG
jgi:hypothetical protein